MFLDIAKKSFGSVFRGLPDSDVSAGSGFNEYRSERLPRWIWISRSLAKYAVRSLSGEARKVLIIEPANMYQYAFILQFFKLKKKSQKDTN